MTSRILIADDEPDIRRLVAFTLRRRGYEVTEASDGDDALLAIQQELPNLVVLDVMMPGMTGLEVAGALAQERLTATIPIIFLSAKGQESEVQQGLSVGARAYLLKPFAPRELANRVAEVLADNG